MATAAIPGFDAQVYVKPSGGSTFNLVGELRDVTLNLTKDPIDATSHDSAGYMEFIDNRKGWTATAEYLYVHNNTAQDDLFTVMTGTAIASFRFIPKNTAALERFSGSGWITSYSLTGPNDDAAATSVEILGSGALTKDAVP